MSSLTRIQIAASIAITVFGSGCHEDSRRVETLSDINALYWSIHDLEHKREAGIDDILRNLNSQGSISNLNTSLASLMAGYDAKNYAFARKPDGSFELRDRWGNALEVHARTEISNVVVASTIVSRADSILIWSKGRNGKNEWGGGDDVVPYNYK